MKCISYNVNGFRAILNKDFDRVFREFDADIFSLNETKLNEKGFKEYFPYLPEGYHVFWTNSKVRNGYSGVAVFTKKEPLSVHYGLSEGKYDDEGRVITLEFECFYYVACYVPNSGEGLKRLNFRLQFEEDIVAYLNGLNAVKPVIYAGDLNVAHREIDLKNPKANVYNAGFTIQERNAMTALLSEGYLDTFRFLHPDKVQYSWWSYRFRARETNAGWRIDYFIVSESLKDRLISSLIHDQIAGSDHCPVELNVDLD